MSFSERRHSNAYAVDTTGRRNSAINPQDVGEQVSWDCDLGYLKGDITGVAEIVGEGVKLKPDGVGGERTA